MFRVEANSLQDYLDFDPERRSELQKLDKLIRRSAPGLKRYFHRGTPAGEPGMRFRMIGYGKFQYVARNGQSVDWPAVGVALQKNYISVYLSVMKDRVSLVQTYSGKLGGLKPGRNHFNFQKYEDLDDRSLAALFAEAGRIFDSDRRDGDLAHRGRKAVQVR
jgi:Domain of unknown function (DU1801)